MTAITLDTRFFGDSLQAAIQEAAPKAREALAQIIDKQCVGSEWTGWFDYPAQRGHDELGQIADVKKSLSVAYDCVLVIGIGGSYLGARAVYESLRHSYDHWAPQGDGRVPMLFLGQHLSEACLIETLDALEGRHPIVNVISKSGTTTEPAIAFRVVRSYLEKRFGKDGARKRIIATTDEERGALRELSTTENFTTFTVPDDVGGRFSVLTPVGMVPLALAGFRVEEIMSGADGMFASLRQADDSHPALQYAAARSAAYAGEKKIELLAFAEPKLAHLAEWWKQLFGESEGKDGKGLFPASLCYTTDLHSLGQYVQDGERNLMETFLVVDHFAAQGGPVERRMRLPQVAENTDQLGYLEGRYVQDVNHAAMQGTRLAHFDGGVPCLEMRLAQWNERTLGELFAFFETACGISAAMLGVNPYDQPGVEDYKKNLFGLLGKPGFEELGTALKERL